MSTSPSPPPPGQRIQHDDVSTNAELARTKRTVALLQAKLAKATGIKRKNVTDVNAGRSLCRLVSLFDPLPSLVDEADRRFSDEQEEDVEEVNELVTQERNRKYTGYVLLLRTVPRVRDMIEDPDQEAELSSLIIKLQRGANEARRDDVRRILGELPQWLNDDYVPTRPFSLKNRRDRGLQNDITGRLLCPIGYDWGNDRVRTNIRNNKISIADDYFLSCFYPKGMGSTEDVEARFLRSQLLVKTFCAIFTSPSSAEAIIDEGEDGPVRKKRKSDAQKKVTKSTVAELIGMEGKVTARSVAYAAVMLAFNLTDCESWRISYNGFNYHGLYNFVVDFFEDVNDPTTQRKVDQLVAWWNQQVFPDHVSVATDSNNSSNKLKEQRAKRAAVSTRD